MKESKKIASNAAQNRKPGSFESFIKNTGVILLLTAVVASLAITTTYVKYFSWSPSYSHDRWAQFGDFIGGTLNPIFGFISLMAILITLFVQARELSYSTEALQDQGESLRMQSFENTFFSLLKILNDSINNAEVEEGQYKGARAFRHMWKMLNDSYSFYVKNKKSNDDVELISKSYDLFYNKNQDSLDSFLRNVLRIIEMVETRCPSSPKQYVKILISQLNNYQLALLFYHIYAGDEVVSKDFLKANNFFSTLPDKVLLDPELHKYIKEEYA